MSQTTNELEAKIDAIAGAADPEQWLSVEQIKALAGFIIERDAAHRNSLELLVGQFDCLARQSGGGGEEYAFDTASAMLTAALAAEFPQPGGEVPK